MTRFRLVPLLLLFAFLPQAKAQLGVYGTFTGSKLDSPHSSWFYGPTLGAYYDGAHFPLINFGIDARVAVLGSGAEPSTKVTSVLVGPRAVLHAPALPLRPYAEALIGAAHVQVGQGVAYSSATHTNYGFAGGVDMTFFPRLDWRVVEYTYTRFTGSSGANAQETLSTGLVFRVPIL